MHLIFPFDVKNGTYDNIFRVVVCITLDRKLYLPFLNRRVRNYDVVTRNTSIGYISFIAVCFDRIPDGATSQHEYTFRLHAWFAS